MKVTASRVRGRPPKGQAKPPQARELAPAPEPQTKPRVPSLTVLEDRTGYTVRIDDVPVGSVGNGGADRRIRWVWKSYRAGHADSLEQGIAEAVGAAWSLVEFVDRQATVSAGPDLARVRKLLKALEKDPDTLNVWLDLILVGIDGYQRNGGNGRSLIQGLDDQQAQLLALVDQ